ncbi:uncharacterized protein MELLADRAFT_113141 [Melampsora larici-populina 98AG31]|uniref:Uncharacterized protein n=1 Tax=Melampsora larici-populina (strain 98AG31 / pathotype 3-4-7) TaxID=747676 RepID=F4S8W3_MELLP|nr:uncharacterized protein MELLADRAFT_113141 [Melampsora larici-populina 98AG31]EGF98876.1 hypothetical protein MELLADRAFT_113141 [Melampsora larici-populina 98AG31]
MCNLLLTQYKTLLAKFIKPFARGTVLAQQLQATTTIEQITIDPYKFQCSVGQAARLDTLCFTKTRFLRDNTVASSNSPYITVLLPLEPCKGGVLDWMGQGTCTWDHHCHCLLQAFYFSW